MRRPVGSMRFPIMRHLSGQMSGSVKRLFPRIREETINRVFDGAVAIEYTD
jgi:hypothetical protein